MNIITARGKPYGLNDLGEAVLKYREISDPLLMLMSEIFEKDSEGMIDQNEAYEYVMQKAEERDLVMETLSKKRLTTILKENFGVITEDTTENKEVINEDGSKTKTKIHRYYYKGIKIKDPLNNKTGSDPSNQKGIFDTTEISDTLEDAMLDYISDLPKDMCIGVSEIAHTLLYIYNTCLGVWGKSDTPIFEVKKCLENLENTKSACVSEIVKSQKIPEKISENSQTEPEKDKENEINKNENISKNEGPEDQGKGQTPNQDIAYHGQKQVNLEKQILWYKSDNFYGKEYFEQFKARLNRYFEYETRHYYELEIPENSLSDDKYKIFTNKAQEIDFQEFENMRERSKEVKK
jgi:hypothetical protein